MISKNPTNKYIYIGIGSNIAPEQNIPASLRLLQEHLNIINISPVYITPPIGSKTQQPDFYNCVIETELKKEITPFSLKYNVLRNIEKQLKRIRSDDKYAPRTIDLDILLFQNIVITSEKLTIPDPDIFSRNFLLAGLFSLNPEIIIYPQTVSISSIVQEYDIQKLKINHSLTQKLRKEFINEHR